MKLHRAEGVITDRQTDRQTDREKLSRAESDYLTLRLNKPPLTVSDWRADRSA